MHLIKLFIFFQFSVEKSSYREQQTRTNKQTNDKSIERPVFCLSFRLSTTALIPASVATIAFAVRLPITAMAPDCCFCCSYSLTHYLSKITARIGTCFPSDVMQQLI